MKTKKYTYKRTMKRIIKMVQYYIDNLDSVPFLSYIAVNPHTGDVLFNDDRSDQPYYSRGALFFTESADDNRRVPDLRSIEHWVKVDLRRFATATSR